MTRRIGLALVTMALGVIIAPGAWADVIPSKRAAKSNDAARVTERLEQVGVPQAQAREQASKMTSDDLAFFSRGAERVQVVAGLTLQEWLLGAGFLGVISLVAFIVIDDAND